MVRKPLISLSISGLTVKEVLGITSSATKVEIKKAYHKAALAHHPDKVAEDERVEAEVRFKSAKSAYEILSDDEKRHLYDTHGMAAFDSSRGGPGGMGAEVDLDDILQQMFNMNMGGMPGMGGFPGMGGMGGPGGPGQRPKKGANEEQEYQVTLEELYKGKTTRFASTKNVICGTCSGSGGKEKAKPHECGACGGRGTTTRLRTIGPGLVTQESAQCGVCSGYGSVFKDRDRCKKCKGKRVVEARKVLELYIPPGSREGEKIVLSGEADQLPGQEPGDIVFELIETPHKVFERAGADLKAELRITLAEALTGFNRIVLTHLDGRGIQMNIKQPNGKILRPGQALKVPGEGMPRKRSAEKGDLYLLVEIDFPEDGFFKDEEMLAKLRGILPQPEPAISAEEVDEVDFDVDADIDDFGAGSDDPRGGAEWEDEEDEDVGPQCQPQ